VREITVAVLFPVRRVTGNSVEVAYHPYVEKD
jgi:hypothetical protein